MIEYKENLHKDFYENKQFEKVFDLLEICFIWKEIAITTVRRELNERRRIKKQSI